MHTLAPLWVDGRPTDHQALHCRGFLPRLLGVWALGGRLPPRTVLCLTPCRSVHTLLLPRPIEVAFCDRGGRILQLHVPLAAQRAVACRDAHQVWEFRVGASLRLGLAVGRRLEVRQCQRQGQHRAQRGAALVEFALVMVFGILPMVLGILQVTHLLVAHDVLSLATFQAARQGSMQGGDLALMRAALARGLLPLYVPVARDGRVAQADALKGFGLALGEVSTLDRVTIVRPARASLRGLTLRRAGVEVVPNEALESRPPALQAANALTLEVTHCQRLVVPLAGPALAAGLALLEAGGRDAPCYALGRVPLRAHATLVMQSDLKLANLP